MTVDQRARNYLRPTVQAEFARYEQDGQKVDSKTAARTRTRNVLIFLGYLLIAIVLGSLLPALKLILVLFGGLLLLALWPKLSKKREDAILDLAAQAPNTPISVLVSRDICPARKLPAIAQKGLLIAMSLIALFLPSRDTASAQDRPGLNRGETTVVQPYEEGWIIVSASQSLAQQDTITLPSEHEGKPILAIGPDAFAGLTNLRHMEVPDTVVFIDKRAFEGCTNLQTITLPEGLETVEGGVFRNCDSLVSLTFPQTVTYIGGECFQYCDRLQEVILPPGITEIRGNTFEGCTSLLRIEIPEGVTRIAAHAFRECGSLEYVYVPSTVTEIGSSAFRQCGSLLEICIPRGASVNERSFKESPTQITYK